MAVRSVVAVDVEGLPHVVVYVHVRKWHAQVPTVQQQRVVIQVVPL